MGNSCFNYEYIFDYINIFFFYVKSGKIVRCPTIYLSEYLSVPKNFVSLRALIV